MPRPSRRKRVCRMPRCKSFCPENGNGNLIRLSLEEYETIRLIDYCAMTQKECAAQMNVARTTVQALYQDARKKMARFLVEGATLIIEGGDVEFYGEDFIEKQMINPYRKGDKNMRLAVTYDNETEEIFQHFGHTESFKLYIIEDGVITATQIVDTNGTGHGALADMLASVGVSTLICGGIGGGARNALAEVGIEIYPGAMGNADANVESFLAGNLNYDPDTMCNHHGEGHTCGGHEGGCGGHHHEGGHCGGGCH